jgi:hypothetical protein
MPLNTECQITINLEKLGAVERKHKTIGAELCINCVAVNESGDTAVGFVTHDREGLSTRQLPAFTLHISVFSRTGTVIRRWEVPTADWRDNELLYGTASQLLVRTGEMLHLFDSQARELSHREIPQTFDGHLQLWTLWNTPNHMRFVMFGTGYRSLQILDAKSLGGIENCEIRDGTPISISNNKVMVFERQVPGDSLLRQVLVTLPCRASGYSYAWHGDPESAGLLNDETILLAGGGKQLKVIKDGTEQWSATLGRNETVDEHIARDAIGANFAIAVREWAGGSSFFDKSPKLKGIRIEVRSASDGSLKKAVSVPSPRDRFDFMLSPDGTSLAILCDMQVLLENVQTANATTELMLH